MWDYRVKQRMAFISILHPNGIILLIAYQLGVTRQPQGGAVHGSTFKSQIIKVVKSTSATRLYSAGICSRSQLSSYQLSGEV